MTSPGSPRRSEARRAERPFARASAGGHRFAVALADPDLPLRQAAVEAARRLARDYDDLVPLERLREGFSFESERVSFGSFQRGIHRARVQHGPAALTLVTSFKDPYADTFDQAGAQFDLRLPGRRDRPAGQPGAPGGVRPADPARVLPRARTEPVPGGRPDVRHRGRPGRSGRRTRTRAADPGHAARRPRVAADRPRLRHHGSSRPAAPAALQAR